MKLAAVDEETAIFTHRNILYIAKCVEGGTVEPLFTPPAEDKVEKDVCSALSVSSDRKKIVFSFSTTKQNYILDYDASSKSVTVSERFKTSKRILGHQFRDGKLFYCDGWGEVVEHGGSPVLGHVSLVNGFFFSSDGDHIVSFDRDEKVRISNFPVASDIRAYGLGHTEFVSAAVEVSGHILSGSGDGHLRLWSMDGDCAAAYDVGLPVLAIEGGAAGFLVVMDRESGDAEVRPYEVNDNTITVGETVAKGFDIARCGETSFVLSEEAVGVIGGASVALGEQFGVDLSLKEAVAAQWKHASFPAKRARMEDE
ncbi:WD domain, G-beta repeat [Carpediemonas membranifera]|uniref:WD domain, G-beta repeat n=1 Tax=Carpediemonas membranifera TaxID=201153 RepID=A0A8J6AXB8_9EUKA|nr:WD domain, G-beta repeat [Carpediemonas membranifera]|eukprot:KAG9390678.1 WD domain, G-beta repeat [Carpediemonas membranifera]